MTIWTQSLLPESMVSKVRQVSPNVTASILLQWLWSFFLERKPQKCINLALLSFTDFSVGSLTRSVYQAVCVPGTRGRARVSQPSRADRGQTFSVLWYTSGYVIFKLYHLILTKLPSQNEQVSHTAQEPWAGMTATAQGHADKNTAGLTLPFTAGTPLGHTT